MPQNSRSLQLKEAEEKIKIHTQNILSELNSLKADNGIVISVDLDNNVHSFGNRVNLEDYRELQQKFSDINYIEEDTELKNIDIPESNGSNFFKTFDYNIGIIADEFLYNSYKNIANFYYVTDENYKSLGEKLDFLLVVSTWKGLNNEWEGMGNPKKKNVRNKIINIINYFKKNNKKTVFYSKEDPPNYDYFIDIAKHCDYIFTTAIEKIEDYKNDCGNDKVFLLKFGVNPHYNNPIGIKHINKKDKVIFAGSWYNKYPQRQKDTIMLFDGVLNSKMDLKVFDRNFYRDSESFLFPVEYLKYISPSIDHKTLQRISKLNRWHINLNSIQFSQTMFASRIFELQCMANLVLSNYSVGINNLFPNVFIVFDKSEVKEILESYTDKELYELQMFGLRKVLRNHTTYHRLGTLLTKIGFKVDNLEEKTVAVVYERKNKNILDNFNRQTYMNKKLVSLEEVKTNFDEFDYVTFFSDDYEYGEFYLEDMINGFKYTNSQFVTKDSYSEGNKKVQGIEHNYTDSIKDRFKTIFSTKHFTFEQMMTAIKNQTAGKGYSIDSLEINTNPNIQVYTSVSKPKFSVIIAAYNNGDHLYSKCFMSLRRSSMFKEMEIIIVDDGSTDNYTTKIIKRLARLYPNVRTFFYNDGGSGSASRPRNKGINLATTNYVTFLDPDNEAINDGYAKLYSFIKNSDDDFVVGNIIRADDKISTVDYYKEIYEKFGGKVNFTSEEVHEFIIETKFKVQSIQAAMYNKQFLINNKLFMLEGVLGEDTLYFHETILSANKFSVLDELVHVYYAGVEGSAVNHITTDFFNKYKQLEIERINFLKKNHILDAYIKLRFEYYFINWYLNKFKKVKLEQKREAAKVISDIYELYKPFINEIEINNEIVNFIENANILH